jgi:hypothetical protein
MSRGTNRYLTTHIDSLVRSFSLPFFNIHFILSLSMKYLLRLVGLLLTAAPLQAASEWPSFRGPDANGTVPDDPRLPIRWRQTEEPLRTWRTRMGKAVLAIPRRLQENSPEQVDVHGNIQRVVIG